MLRGDAVPAGGGEVQHYGRCHRQPVDPCLYFLAQHCHLPQAVLHVLRHLPQQELPLLDQTVDLLVSIAEYLGSRKAQSEEQLAASCGAGGWFLGGGALPYTSG